jgi:hypothetical protein
MDMIIGDKAVIFETSMLSIERHENDKMYWCSYKYKGTRYFNDGTSEEFERPAYDIPIFPPIYKD